MVFFGDASLDWRSDHRCGGQKHAKIAGIVGASECISESVEIAARDKCCERAKQRNQTIKQGQQQNTFEMTPEMLALFWSQFEVPNDAEREQMICVAPNSANVIRDGQ